MTNKCPICKKDTVPTHRPFCSKRCADADLGNWLKGNYAIAAVDPLTEDEMPSLDALTQGDRDNSLN